ncbi:hypothetical protein N7533_000746 [Penicillium manginii]|uniref:uncharacterized protein n=1 Tax=Penicillium manginii TaxID=203109 RepID=UPI00254674CD|nr:uncharacterized protein N7533_000746 [Penicillium manginii]KAJ5768163.1 hypothetical protein N7533_000746 [Penicillium manginii]
MARSVDRLQVDGIQRSNREIVAGGKYDVYSVVARNLFHAVMGKVADMPSNNSFGKLDLQGFGTFLDSGNIRRCDVHLCMLGEGLFCNSIVNSRTAADDKNREISD